MPLVTFDDRNISETEMFTVSKVNYSGSVSDNGQVYIPLALVDGYTPISLSAYVNSSSGGTLMFSAPVFGSNYCYTRCFSRNGASTFNVTIHILHIKNEYVPS